MPAKHKKRVVYIPTLVFSSPKTAPYSSNSPADLHIPPRQTGPHKKLIPRCTLTPRGVTSVSDRTPIWNLLPRCARIRSMPKEIDLKEFFSKLSLGNKILVSLLTAGSLAEEALGVLNEFSPRATVRKLYTSRDFNDFNKDKRLIRKALLRLVKRQLVEIEEADKELSVKLTQAGLETLFSKFPNVKFQNWEWDGEWRVIIYDIEEETRRLRRRLRHFLRSHGFNLVQKSVWFSPYPIENELETFLRKEGLWEKIMVFKTILKDEDSARLIKGFYPNLNRK